MVEIRDGARPEKNSGVRAAHATALSVYFSRTCIHPQQFRPQLR